MICVILLDCVDFSYCPSHSYPSGRLAISIVTFRPGLFTYTLQTDADEADIVAIFEPTGRGVIYYDNGLPRFVDVSFVLCSNPCANFLALAAEFNKSRS